jgi:DNA (cytosine-5)-methyltransferase 1
MIEELVSVFEQFEYVNESLRRTVKSGVWSGVTEIPCSARSGGAKSDWDLGILKGDQPRIVECPLPRRISIADLFCGAGGLSVGVAAAATALGMTPRIAFGGDHDGEALQVYAQNLHAATTFVKGISNLVDYLVEGQADYATFAYPPEVQDYALDVWHGNLDILVGGPPCQGHSNLNNWTRRDDPRNLLYLAMPAIAVALDVPCVIIENVPDVRQDKDSVFTTACSLLRSEGYTVETQVMNSLDLGVPQTRKRLFVVASKGSPPAVLEAYRACSREPRSLMYAIADLEGCIEPGTFRSPANYDPVTQSRIDYLFDNDLYELPDLMRPDCHKDGHSYPSVYGRLRPDQPAGTITQGFNTMGRGRFIHPTQRRSITPHEAARLQGFPDSFVWKDKQGNDLSRSSLAKLIGNAVPPAMGYVAGLAAIGTLIS